MIDLNKKKTIMRPQSRFARVPGVPRLDRPKPLRYLPRRVVQAMADHASANLLLGERTVPGRFIVYRLVEDESEREELERQFAESHAVMLQEISREAQTREFRLRGELAVRLHSLLPSQLPVASRQGPVDSSQSAVGVTGTEEEEASVLEEESEDTPPPPSELPAAYSLLTPDHWSRLEAERELILPERLRALRIESRPPGAAIYLDNRQMDRVTPGRLTELPAGTHALSLALPGYVLYETEVEVPEAGEGEILVTADLEPEPPMGVLEIITFPSQATVTVAGVPGAVGPVSRPTPARLRLPAGRVRLRIEHPDCAPLDAEYELPPGSETAPGRLQLRLQYAGDDRDEPVGRLIVYKPESGPRAPRDVSPLERPEDTIASFFQDQGVDLDESSHVTMAAGAPSPTPEVLGERPLHKGVLLIGREDRHALVTPDVKLFDPANTVSRGCHAWLHVYTDPGTGAEYNTFVIHNNSAAGLLVNGRLVMESAALGDDAEIKIGIFRMRVVKETPVPRVEF